jgi:glycosyltransferase involved in cell wall biosynthesis
LDNPVIASRLIQHTDFIPDHDIPYYFGAADFIIQPYKSATQSGVTPLAYFYEKAMLVTNVGGLPDLVPDKEVGLVVEPEPKAIADGILELYRLGEAHFQLGGPGPGIAAPGPDFRLIPYLSANIWYKQAFIYRFYRP